MLQSVLNKSVLLLNQNYQPLNLCNTRRAIVLVRANKAEILEFGEEEIRTVSEIFLSPSVIRLMYLVRSPIHRHRLSRRDIFLRDQNTCQYCGEKNQKLTLDHIIPRRLGGQHTWANIVAACSSCNHEKAGKLLNEVRLKLKRNPEEPKPNPYLIFQRHEPRTEWKKFLPNFV